MDLFITILVCFLAGAGAGFDPNAAGAQGGDNYTEAPFTDVD